MWHMLRQIFRIGLVTEAPPATDAELIQVRKICRSAAESYARLIATSKQQRDAMR